MESNTDGKYPVLVLACLWGAFDVILKVFEVLNKQRDKILEIIQQGNDKALSTTLSWDHVFYSDWLPLWVGLGGFLIVALIVMAKMSVFFLDNDQQRNKAILTIRNICVLLLVVAIIGWLLGGYIDIDLFFTSRGTSNNPKFSSNPAMK